VALAEGRLTRAAALAFAAVLLAAGCGGSTTVTQTVTVTSTRTVTAPGPGAGTTASGTSAGACSGADLDGSFAVVQGSAGAGQISYELTLTNVSRSTCFVSGIPNVQLLDASGSPLPTHVAAAQPGQALAARIALAPGDSAYAQARFSPDVPGVGEQQSGRCEPEAASLRVSPQGAASLVVPVTPPTPVCEQGALSFDLLSSSP
jgi:hypothetical protein